MYYVVCPEIWQLKNILINPPPPPPVTRTKYIDIKKKQCGVSDCLRYGDCAFHYFCMVLWCNRLISIPSKWTSVHWRARPMQKSTDGFFQHPFRKDRYPPKTTINPQVDAWILCRSFCVVLEGDGCVGVGVSPRRRGSGPGATVPLQSRTKPLARHWQCHLTGNWFVANEKFKVVSLQCRLSHNANRENAAHSWGISMWAYFHQSP